jgi:hypothetical protein
MTMSTIEERFAEQERIAEQMEEAIRKLQMMKPHGRWVERHGHDWVEWSTAQVRTRDGLIAYVEQCRTALKALATLRD